VVTRARSVAATASEVGTGGTLTVRARAVPTLSAVPRP
jgi:hypothetical protein